jgi:protein TonB
MRKGVIVSLLLHSLVLAAVLFVYAPRWSAPVAAEATLQTRFVAQTVNIEALQPTPLPVPVTAAAPPIDAPKPVVSEAEQAVAVAPVKPKTIEPSKPKPPPRTEVANDFKPAPKKMAEGGPPPEPVPAPQQQPLLPTKPPQQHPTPKALAEKELPTAKPPPPEQNKHLALMNNAPASTAPSSAPQAAPTAGARTTESDADYLMHIRTLIEQQKRYPPMAQRLGMEGEVRLWFVLDRQGRVLDYRIDQGSGHAMLDEEVERLIQQIAAFPPVPPDMGVSRLELVVPINFHLAG